MNDISSLLTQVAEQADPTLLASPDQIRAAVTRRRRRASALGAVALLAVAATAGVVLGTNPTTPSPAPPVNAPAPTPSPDSTPTRAPVTSTAGTPVTVAPGISYFDIRAVAHLAAQGRGSGVYVVVGDTSGTFTTKRVVPPIWWSVDARTWHHAHTGPRFPNVWDVAADSHVLVAVAPRGQRSSTAWYSTDGDHWLRAAVPTGFKAFAISSTHNGFFAWGDHGVFTSANGTHWSRLTYPPGPTVASYCFIVQDIHGHTVLGSITSTGGPTAWVRDNHGWTSRPSLISTDPSWCGRHVTAQSTATGPAGSVSLRLNGPDRDTVFLQRN